jgi:cardiolipin synthase
LTTYAVFPDELQGPSTERGVLVRPLVNYWFRRQRFIYSSYLRAIASAKERIVIANSYFLPNTGLRRELLRARRRGVRVQLLISRKSDVKVVDWAMHSVYPGFLKAGVEIYEWLPSVLHAKVAVVDGIWSTIGSFNMDAVSLFVNIEMNVNILDSSIGRQLEERIQKVIETQCQRVTEKSLARIGVIQLVWSALIYQLYRMITNVVMLFRATADAPFEAGDRL